MFLMIFTNIILSKLLIVSNNSHIEIIKLINNSLNSATIG